MSTSSVFDRLGIRPIIAIGAVLGVLALALTGSLLALRASQAPRLPGISNSQLLEGGIVLTAPPFATFPKVSQAQAENIASGSSQTHVQGAVLARFHFMANSSIDCLCWVVSLRPSGLGGFSGPPGPPGSSQPTYAIRFELVFVDAETGHVTFSRVVGMPSDSPTSS